MDYEPRFSHVAALAKRLGKPVTVFDLETTIFRGRPDFGITEVACFTVSPRGPGLLYGTLVNPERPISPQAAQVTGITQDMVRDAEPWGNRWAGVFRQLAEKSWLAGFNSSTFDCPAVLEMNERYGQPIEGGFPCTFDVRELHLALSMSKSRKGVLQEVARCYEVKPSNKLHRAVADCVLTLEVLDAIIELYTLDVVLEHILPKRPGAIAKLTAQNIARFAKGKERVSVEELSRAFATEPRLVRFELGKAIDERLVEPDVFANEDAQAWLQEALMEADPALLKLGKLKPLLEHLAPKAPDASFADYVQLRIALHRVNCRWASLKPLEETA